MESTALPGPDVIVVTARYEEEVEAEHADLAVTVEGSSLVTGRAAMTKAKEVRALVDALRQCEVEDADIHLESVRAELSSGFLGNSSSAHYRLRIRCRDLDRLAEVLGAITSAKNVRLDDVVWSYDESAAQQAEWLARCIADANLKASAAAQALGTRIVGVHRLTESAHAGPMPPVHMSALSMGAVKARGRMERSVDLGFELGHRRKMGVHVTVEYRVEGYAPSPQAQKKVL